MPCSWCGERTKKYGSFTTYVLTVVRDWWSNPCRPPRGSPVPIMPGHTRSMASSRGDRIFMVPTTMIELTAIMTCVCSRYAATPGMTGFSLISMAKRARLTSTWHRRSHASKALTCRSFVTRVTTVSSFAATGKLAAENFSDTYHVFKVHPGLDDTYAQVDCSTAYPDGVHMFMLNTLPEPGHLFSPVKVRGLPNLTGVPKERQLAQPAAILFPNVGMVVSPANLQFTYFEPVSADRCIMHLWFYFVGEAAEGPEHEEARQLIVADFRKINVEDEGICLRLQQGRQCDAYDGGRLAPYWDAGTAHYHRQVADAILGRGAFARA